MRNFIGVVSSMNDAATSEARYPKLVLATTILASSLSFVDGSVVNVGLPAIGASFNASGGALQWVVNAYLLPLSALLLLGGAAGDHFGRVRLLVIGTGLFGLASIACVMAPTLYWLILARSVQGVGSAMLMPNSLAILGASFSGEARGRSIGIWAAVGAAMTALGPVLGGSLIDSVGWRAIFLINLPLAAGAIVLALFFVDDPRAERDVRTLDLLGAFSATVALGLLTWGLTMGSSREGWTMTALLMLGGGVSLSVAFLAIERMRGDRAMMSVALFGSTSFVGLSAITLLVYGAMGALMVMMPYFLIRADGYSSTAAGGALLPFALVLALASPVMGIVAGHIGPRLPLTIGSLIMSAGFLMALRIAPRGSYWTDVFPSILLIAIGMAAAVAPLTAAVLASVDKRHAGSASGLNTALARTGGMVATALLGGVLGASGLALVEGFHTAALACAVASAAAAASAFFSAGPDPRYEQ